MEIENFSLEHVASLYNPELWKEYITKWFFPLSDGNHLLIEYKENGDVINTIKDAATIKSVYFNRMSKEMNTFYFKEYKQIRTLTTKLNQPKLFGNKFNLCGSFLHSRKPYSEYPEEIKTKVEIMKSFYLENWTKGNVEQFNFIMQWIANMVRGGKNQSLLYLRSSTEGIGKSTGSDFLHQYVIGRALCYKGGSAPLVSQFNSILQGKLLVIYEELENMGPAQWKAIGSKIKRDLTANTANYESKGVDLWEGENLNNVIINSNVDAIQDDAGRRIFCLDLNIKRKGDIKYWDSIYACMNAEVGEAFYNYLYDEINLDHYKDQNFPETEAKKSAIAKRLPSPYAFIKDDYVLENRGMKINLKMLYEEYEIWCRNNDKKPMNKPTFHEELEVVGIESKKSGNDSNKFVYSKEYLLNIATKKNWIHKTDEFVTNTKSSTPDDEFVDEDEFDYKTEYKKLLAKYNKLKNNEI